MPWGSGLLTLGAGRSILASTSGRERSPRLPLRGIDQIGAPFTDSTLAPGVPNGPFAPSAP
jgi:hypothetical protein